MGCTADAGKQDLRWVQAALGTNGADEDQVNCGDGEADRVRGNGDEERFRRRAVWRPGRTLHNVATI